MSANTQKAMTLRSMCKKKNLTNTRSSGADEALRLTPPKELSLEQALDYIDTDELLKLHRKIFVSVKKFSMERSVTVPNEMRQTQQKANVKKECQSRMLDSETI